jgi:hypothetical protein
MPASIVFKFRRVNRPVPIVIAPRFARAVGMLFDQPLDPRRRNVPNPVNRCEAGCTAESNHDTSMGAFKIPASPYTINLYAVTSPSRSVVAQPTRRVGVGLPERRWMRP